MRQVYVDSGAFIALLWRRDRDHERMSAHLRRLRETGDRLLTSNLVVAETATRLRYDAGLQHALAFRDLLADAEVTGRMAVHHADAEVSRLAWDEMRRFDTLALSFADCVGAVTARRARAEAVFGLDRDFAALGFALEP
ncbi:MAG: PIN domain-containing protein [Solirubrobacteraceae bacterium MAG38_C4-C5]|nr:PIN domain-containing protein [Candidatus Siliceabacter maunaloa]